jgi:hypothetical protein
VKLVTAFVNLHRNTLRHIAEGVQRCGKPRFNTDLTADDRNRRQAYSMRRIWGSPSCEDSYCAFVDHNTVKS